MCNCANFKLNDSYNCDSNSLIGIGITILDYFSGRNLKKHQFGIEFNSHYFFFNFQKNLENFTDYS